MNSTLLEAERLVNGPRNKSYGSFSQQARDIADILRIMKRRRKDSGGRPFTDEELVGWVFIITKITREAQHHKRDNFVDLNGYAELTCRLTEEIERDRIQRVPRRKMSARLRSNR